MKWNLFKQNNDRHIAQQIKAATRIGMDDASRERMRAHLFEYAKLRPIRAHGALHARPQNWFVVFFSARIQSVSIVTALLIVMVTGGTVAASETALPGDILYPIKVHVTEEVQASLAVTPKAKAAWAMDRAERRLEEAATLALAGKLNDVTRAQIDSNLDEHVQSAKENRKTLVSENDLSAAEEVKTNIGAVTLARENILGESGLSSKALVTEEATPTANVAMRADVASDTKVTSTSPNEGQIKTKILRNESDTVTKGRRTAAKARIEATKKFLSGSNRLGADVSARAQAQLQTATDALTTGDADAARGNTQEASSNFGSALQAATDIQTLISVSASSSNSSNGQDSQNKNGDGQKAGGSGATENSGISL